MTYVHKKRQVSQRREFLGMAGILDSARMAHLFMKSLDMVLDKFGATVMGGHGDKYGSTSKILQLLQVFLLKICLVMKRLMR